MLKTHAVNAFEIRPHHHLANAAGFIQVNMPWGKGGTLSKLEAWDVAAFMTAMNACKTDNGPVLGKP